MTVEGAQAAWLERLDEAGRFKNWVCEEIRPFVSGKTFEVGCGTGSYTEMLATWAESVYAVDLDARSVAAARRRTAGFSNVRVEQADATRLSGGRCFDTVVMLDVLEHIEADVATLVGLRALLAPGGRILIKVPAGPWLYGSLDRAIGHYRRYDRSSLRRAAAAASLVIDRSRYFNMAAVPGWWFNGRLLGRTAPPAKQVKLFDRLVPVLRRLDRAFGPPFGISLIAVASAAATGHGQDLSG